VGEISGNTWGVDNIVESELIDERAGLEEEGQWLGVRLAGLFLSGFLRFALYLSNSSGCTSDN